MKELKFILIALILTPLMTQAQTLAVTELGDTIYIYDNGTWSFEILEEMPQVSDLDYLNEELAIETISTPFTYPKSAKKIVENKNKLFEIQYDGTKWERIPPAQLNPDAEFAFKSKERDIWCVVISEETPIGAETLMKIAKQGMKQNTGEDVEVVKAERRTVNGIEVVRGVFKANISDISFTFDSYYYSNEEGSVQFTTWTSDRVWESDSDTILELLNGFVAN